MRRPLSAFLIVLAAAPAFAASDPERKRYVEESTTVCAERVQRDRVEVCEVAILAGAWLWDMEHGQIPESEFVLDSRDPEELASIARACREATMDGKLIDGFEAVRCVAETVRLRNWEARRARRAAPVE